MTSRCAGRFVQVSIACFALISSGCSSGTVSTQPTRKPGATILENVRTANTSGSPPPSSRSVGSGSPSKRNKPYGSSSITIEPHRRASSRSRSLRSNDIVTPDGFWNVGIV